MTGDNTNNHKNLKAKVGINKLDPCYNCFYEGEKECLFVKFSRLK